MRLRSLVKLLIFCWTAVIIGVTSYISKWESKLPDVEVEYNVQPLFTSPKLVFISALRSISLQEYLGNPPAKVSPEPRGPPL